MELRSLLNDTRGVIDLTVVITIGIVFAALMVIAYIIWTLKSSLVRTGVGPTVALNNSVANITGGFDSGVKLILICITVAILAIALSYLMMLRGGGA